MSASPFLEPGASVLFLVSVPVVLLVVSLFALVNAARHWRCVRRAETRAAAISPDLQTGPTILFGTVEADEEEPVVVIEMRQEGTQWRVKGGVRHRWTETSREARSHPFALRLPTGERVWVEPGERVFLIDLLRVITNRDDARRRTLRAELSHDEEVYAEGRLERGATPSVREARGYRDDTQGWVLRPPAVSSMLLSTESLAARHVRRRRFWLGLAASAALLALLFHGVASWMAWPFLDDPVCMDAEITQRRESTGLRRRGRPTGSVVLHAILTGPCEVGGDVVLIGSTLTAQVSPDEWSAFPEGDHLTFTVARTRRSVYRLGWGGGVVSIYAPLLVGVLFLLFVLTAIRVHQSQTAWYETKRVVHDGEGALIDSPEPN